MTVLDWRMRHGPITGPVHAFSALACVAAVGGLPAVDLEGTLVLAAGVFGAGAVCLRHARPGVPRSVAAYRVTAVLAGSIWLSDVLTVGWSVRSVVALAAGAALFGVLRRPVDARRRAAELVLEQQAEAVRQQQEEVKRRNLAEHWVHRIATVCKVDVAVLGIEAWMHPGPDGRDRQTGFTLELRLPADGSTWQDIAAHITGLAAAEDLPNGCGIEVEPGVSRRVVLVHVSTVDALVDVIPLPPSSGPRSANELLDLGIRRDGSKAEVSVRSNSVVLVGSTESGKSNELLVLMTRLIECMDTLVLVIDMNGGGLAIPWLVPWATGQARTPSIYWVADSAEEALRMLEWLAALIGARKRSQGAAMRAADDDKVAVSHTVPQIVLVTDEAGSLPAAVMNRIVDISDRGRGAAIRTVTCGLRATSEYIPTALRAQAAVRIAMRTNDPGELGYFYARGHKLDGADVPDSGYGFIGVKGQNPYVHKGYRVTPTLIAERALATSAHRPADVEQETLDLLPEEIRMLGMNRWKRTKHIRQAAATGEAVNADQAEEEIPRGAAPPRPHPGGMDGALDDLRAKREQLRETMRAAGGGDAFEDLVEGLRSGVVPELLIRVLAAIGDAPRMHTAVIATAVRVPPQALGGLLSQVGCRPLKNAFDVASKPGRGYARADVEAAADRIRLGEQTVPDAVARWRPTP